MTLYLKYRPQTIDELDLESVRTSLKNIILSGNIPHAFLFSGPKGTGKTSAARILAKVINCENLGKDGEPCNVCSSCISITKGNNIDIIELDAASNRGIDDIRSLKEGIYLSPVRATKKIYIIDEAHMLTLEAANAFLKTLEEPPDHVVFILATTNPEKLPATVISRLTQVNFTRASDKDIARQLNRVAKGESLSITPQALTKISKLADGSFRDAVKILENLSFKTKDIKDKDVGENNSQVKSFFEILATRNAKNNLEFINNLVQNGVSIKVFLDDIIDNLHKSVLAKNGLGEDHLTSFSASEILNLIELISNAKNEISPINELPFEIAIVKFCNSKSNDNNPTETKQEQRVVIKVEEKKTENKEIKVLDDELWNKLLLSIREKHVSIEALLRASKVVDFDGKILTLGVYYQFHKDKLEDIKNKNILEKVCLDTFGIESLKIIFELIEKPKSIKLPDREPVKESLTPSADKDIIDAAKEIFG